MFLFSLHCCWGWLSMRRSLDPFIPTRLLLESRAGVRQGWRLQRRGAAGSICSEHRASPPENTGLEDHKVSPAEAVSGSSVLLAVTLLVISTVGHVYGFHHTRRGPAFTYVGGGVTSGDVICPGKPAQCCVQIEAQGRKTAGEKTDHRGMPFCLAQSGGQPLRGLSL